MEQRYFAVVQENTQLKRENEQLRAELAEMTEKAEALCHINTYTMQQMNSPLKLILGGKCD